MNQKKMKIVAVACASVPYVVIRGPVSRLTRGLCKSQDGQAHKSATHTEEDTEGRPEN